MVTTKYVEHRKATIQKILQTAQLTTEGYVAQTIQVH